MTAPQLPEPVRQRRLAWLKDTREFYFDENMQPLPGRRAVDECENCVYLTNDGRSCAIGRKWSEFHARTGSVCDDEPIPRTGAISNRRLAIVLATRDGIHSGNDGETLHWLRQLQTLHDIHESVTSTRRTQYARMLSDLGEAVPA